VVFNTAMTGYQEILTDPSYCRQIVTLTYPHIGNTGVNREDEESRRVWAAGLVIRDLPLLASNFRSEQTLDAYLRERGVVGDRRHRHPQADPHPARKGAQNGCIMAGAVDRGRRCRWRAHSPA
jgi:carbamoyl-phosphate synthase small subunit